MLVGVSILDFMCLSHIVVLDFGRTPELRFTAGGEAKVVKIHTSTNIRQRSRFFCSFYIYRSYISIISGSELIVNNFKNVDMSFLTKRASILRCIYFNAVNTRRSTKVLIISPVGRGSLKYEEAYDPGPR